MHSVSLIRSFSRLNLECRLQPVISTSQSSFHTTSVQESRIKRRHVHKPFFHIKKTAKHADEPLTGANARFVQQMVKQSYGTSILDTYVRPDSEENSEEGSPLRPELRPWPRGSWDEQGVFTTRVGLIGRKIGVVPMWDNRGRRMTTTLIQIEDNHVVRHISQEAFAKSVVAEKYSIPKIVYMDRPTNRDSLVVGALSADPAKFTKDYCGLFTDSGVMPKKLMMRSPVSSNALVQPGTPLNAGHFQPGQFVDVVARTSRRGFQGVMKRWGFSGMPTDKHGVTKSHRRPGCIGSGRKKSRVWPGQKMPGHVGGDFRRMLGLKIVRINYKHNVLYIKGQGIPGEPGEMVKVFDCKTTEKRFNESPRHFPTCYPEQYEQLPEEEYAEGMFKFNDPTITF